jgi:hypothetical protein
MMLYYLYHKLTAPCESIDGCLEVYSHGAKVFSHCNLVINVYVVIS